MCVLKNMATSGKKKTGRFDLVQNVKAIQLLEQGRPAYRVAEDFSVGKTQIQNLKMLGRYLLGQNCLHLTF